MSQKLPGATATLSRRDWVELIESCRSPAESRKIHSRVASIFSQDVFMLNKLIEMHGKCGDWNRAGELFDSLQNKDEDSWERLLMAYCENGEVERAKVVFQRMPRRSLLSATALISSLSCDQAMDVLKELPWLDHICWNAVLSSAVREGDLRAAEVIFQQMPGKCLISWTAMLTVLAQGSSLESAEAFFDQMPTRNLVSWTVMLAAYAQNGYLKHARSIFDSMPEWDAICYNAMLAAYGQSGLLEKALEVFNSMPERILVSWNAILTAFAQNGQIENAERLFRTMPQRDFVSWNAMLGAFSDFGFVDRAERLFKELPVLNVVSWSSLLAAYAQNGSFEKCKKLFSEMPFHGIVAWNVLLSVCAEEGQLKEAKEVFRSMPERDVVAWTTMLDVYAQAGHLEDAKHLFDTMPHRSQVTWNAMLGAFVQCGKFEDSKGFFDQMPQQNIISCTAMLVAYAQNRDLVEAKYLFDSLPRQNVVAWNAMFYAFAQNGHVDRARVLFETFPRRDIISWNSLLAVYTQNQRCKEALDVFDAMKVIDLWNQTSLVSVLAACGQSGSVSTGRNCFVSMVLDFGMEPNKQHYCCLVDLLGRGGYLLEAEELLVNMPFVPDVLEWTCFLGACKSHNNLSRGSFAAKSLADLKVRSGGFLVLVANMYKDDQLNLEAGAVAPENQDKDSPRNSVSQTRNLSMGSVLASLEECKKSRDLQKGKSIHKLAAETTEYCSNTLVANLLVDMYAKCGSMEDAKLVFQNMVKRDVVSWTCMIQGFAQNKQPELALEFYSRMQDAGCSPDRVTVLAALKACSRLAEKEEGPGLKLKPLEKARALHARAEAAGFISDTVVANSLLDVYSKCGSIDESLKIFKAMRKRDVVSWTSLISGYVQCGQSVSALKLYSKMLEKGCQPDRVTILAALKACASLGEQAESKLEKRQWLKEGGVIHAQASERGLVDHSVENSLVDMYAKCGSLEEARKVFDGIRRRSLVSWRCMVLGYGLNDEHELALELYDRMRDEGFSPDRVLSLAAMKACSSLATGAAQERKQWCLDKGKQIHSHVSKVLKLDHQLVNSLIDLYSKSGSMDLARSVFESSRSSCSVVSWNCIILGYAQAGQEELALRLYSTMRSSGFTPDAATFVAVLKACIGVGDLELGKKVYSEARALKLAKSLIVANALVDFFGKCGSLDDAEEVFYSAERRDLVSWSSLIAAYSTQGKAERVLELFEVMQEQSDLKPDGVIFLSVLTACSHTGLVDKGKRYFEDMVLKHSIDPRIEHYTCMVDLLGRSNQLDEALGMIRGMRCKPDVVIWKALLGACCKWKNVEVGKIAFESLLELNGRDPAAYILISNLYATAGDHKFDRQMNMS